jgi:hypothetical protein
LSIAVGWWVGCKEGVCRKLSTRLFSSAEIKARRAGG